MQFSFPPASPSRWLKWSPPSSSWPSSTPPASASNPTSPSSMRCTSPSVSWQIQIEFLQFSLRKSHLQKQLSWDLRPWKGLASFRQYVEVGLGLIAWWEHFCKFSIYINGAQWGGGWGGWNFWSDENCWWQQLSWQNLGLHSYQDDVPLSAREHLCLAVGGPIPGILVMIVWFRPCFIFDVAVDGKIMINALQWLKNPNSTHRRNRSEKLWLVLARERFKQRECSLVFRIFYFAMFMKWILHLIPLKYCTV